MMGHGASEIEIELKIEDNEPTWTEWLMALGYWLLATGYWLLATGY
jgi:hypothetical protein